MDKISRYTTVQYSKKLIQLLYYSHIQNEVSKPKHCRYSIAIPSATTTLLPTPHNAQVLMEQKINDADADADAILEFIDYPL